MRAWVAYVAGRLIAKSTKHGVIDLSSGRHVPLVGSVSESAVRIFDAGRGCLFAGSGKGGSFALLDHSRTAYVFLHIRGNQFSGVDQGLNHQFSGIVNGIALSLFDHSDGSWSQYSV